MEQKNLGSQGLDVAAIGLGCMGMTPIAHMDVYGEADEGEAIATIHRSLELTGMMQRAWLGLTGKIKTKNQL